MHTLYLNHILSPPSTSSILKAIPIGFILPFSYTGILLYERSFGGRPKKKQNPV
jgi:hypothetical protein